MPATAEARITAFAKTLPSLRHQAHIDAFDADSLDAWASTVASDGQRMAVRLVLTIYNQHNPGSAAAST